MLNASKCYDNQNVFSKYINKETAFHELKKHKLKLYYIIVEILFVIQYHSMSFSHVYLYRLFVQCSSAHK